MTYIAGIGFGEDSPKKKKNLVAKSSGMETSDDSGSEGETESEYKVDSSSMAKSGAKTAASGGDGSQIASNAMMASGNPYLIAAGAGLGVLSAHQARNRANAQAKVDMEMERRARIAQAMSNLGTGVGSIG